MPNQILLKEVFHNYIKTQILSLKLNDSKKITETVEFEFLRDLTLFLFSKYKREESIENLKINETLSKYFIDESNNPLSKLINLGIISTRKVEYEVFYETEIVFITYERVFEFLLSIFVIKKSDVDKITKYLIISQEYHFPQLRGASELAVSFDLMQEETDFEIILELTQEQISGGNQFICDVMQTIFDSGKESIVKDFLKRLNNKNYEKFDLLSLQIAFQLNMYDKLIEYSITENKIVMEYATLYIYQSWNKLRQKNRLDEAYKIIYELYDNIKIVSFDTIIKFNNISKSRFSLTITSLFEVSKNMLKHIVDDPQSVLPLLDIFQKLINKIKLHSVETENGEFKLQPQNLSNLIIWLLKKSFGNLLVDQTSFSRGFFEDNKLKRAMLDIGSLIIADDLSEIKNKVLKLINWKHASISGSSRSILTHQIYINYETNFSIIQSWLYSEELNVVVKNNLVHSLTYGTIACFLKNPAFDIDYTEELMIDFKMVWDESKNANIQDIRIYTEKEDFNWLMQNVLLGIFFIEASTSFKKGTSSEGSKNIGILLKDINNSTSKNEDICFILDSLLKLGYQGFHEFVISTILNQEFKHMWYNEINLRNYTIKLLGNLRALYHDEVDNILQEIDKNLWLDIIKFDLSSNLGELSDIGYRHWIMVGTATNMTIMKISGRLLVELANSKSKEEFVDRSIRTLLSLFFDKIRLDIFHVQYGLSHDIKWNLFDTFEINKEVLNVRPELHNYYERMCKDIVQNFGKGVLYEDK